MYVIIYNIYIYVMYIYIYVTYIYMYVCNVCIYTCNMYMYIYILYMLYTYLGKSWPKNILAGVISFVNDGLILPNVKDKEVYR